MAYTGDVSRGSAPAVRTLDHLTITKVSVGPMDNNAYLLRCGDDQLLIDAANDDETLLALIGHAGLTTVVTTHRHGDHWQALEDVVEATGARSLAHAADAGEIPVVTGTLAEGDTVTVGDCELEVIHLVGHTPGSIALLYRDPNGHAHLWTGDSLFPGGPGRTTNPTEFHSLMTDLETKVFGRLPDETWFYPGHGRDSTLGKERPSIPEWRARGW
ncbi:MBL fold metallo-hydrolase [Actinoplanes subtropicus]|uniref:MBL fold metallo-hydrolase n=1 Tax=Actinoplanes subtropicus TaxID=543632 RepID=UPI0004C3CAAB|nr:MBL fold metallo-hydrolase [Actinoplanes subtropicus]